MPNPPGSVTEPLFEARLRARRQSFVLVGASTGFVFHLAAIFIELFVTTIPVVMWTVQTAHAATLFLCFFWFFGKRANAELTIPFYLAGSVITVGAYVITLHFATRSGNPLEVCKAWTTYVLLGAFIVHLLPALLERQFVAVGIVERNSGIERELAAARDIHDSMRAPAAFTLAGYEFQVPERTGAEVGGHWIAAREDAAGRGIIAICDTSDHGFRGALVLHALQALWAEALGARDFGPEAWLARANRCLTRMSTTAAHSATVCLLRLGPAGAEAFSAGHWPPRLCAVGAASDGSGEPRGRPLGSAVVLTMEALTVALPNGSELRLAVRAVDATRAPAPFVRIRRSA